MWIRLAALAASLSWCCALAAQTPERLDLEDAIARALADHPELRAAGFLGRVLEAEASRAALPPPRRVELELENAPATSDGGAFALAETTLSLAGLLERGGKREARRALAARRIDAQAVRRVASELDLAAEVARRYLDLARAEAQIAIVEQDVVQREAAVAAAARRVAAGASPEFVQLGAEAALARARMLVTRTTLEREAAWGRLQVLWGGSGEGAPPATSGDLLELPSLAPLGDLQAQLERSPELRLLADEQRIREARLTLARSAAAADIEWRLGVRRLEAGDDLALVAGASLPLGTRARAEAEQTVARAELDALGAERESSRRQLAGLLAQAHGEYQAAAAELQHGREELLPRLDRAAVAAERAWRAGAATYQEWAQVQAEIMTARHAALASALQARRALIEMQRLTAEPIVAAPAGRTQP